MPQILIGVPMASACATVLILDAPLMSSQGLTFITDNTLIVQGDFQPAPRLIE
jgi:hypothetical protein